MGGSVALCFAENYPQRVRTLGLVDTTAWYGPDAEKAWDERAQRARENGLASMIDFQETRWFGEAFRAEHPDVVARARELFLANDLEAYAATCAMLGRFDLRPKLDTVRVPVAVVVGEEDYATPPAMAEQLHAGIAGSTLEVIPGARHLTPLQVPDVIAQVLESLIDRERR
jgi:3-oxoadipate enol-lactonase